MHLPAPHSDAHLMLLLIALAQTKVNVYDIYILLLWLYTVQCKSVYKFTYVKESK